LSEKDQRYILIFKFEEVLIVAGPKKSNDRGPFA